MSRKLFCQLSPVTYAISAEKERLLRRIKDWHQKVPFAVNRQEEALPVTWYTHRSLIFRTLGNTQLQLQAGKAVLPWNLHGDSTRWRKFSPQIPVRFTEKWI